MRFKRIQIPAFGPFTDREIELPKGESDFHLIYGPNEAGKSSLLRTIRALLFGIHPRTQDNFLHGNKDLRIAAEVEGPDGTSQFFQRRKGQKNTLLDADGKAAPDDKLHQFLGVVDESYFDSMFGLGSEELREGANQLLRGEGRLGEALFSASLGGTPVEKVIKSLEAEASRFFAGRARKSIREALSELNEHRKRAKEALVKPEAWEAVEQDIERLTKQREALLQQRKEKSARKAWLERCEGAQPLVSQLAERRRQLENLPDLPDLPLSFAEEIKTARNDLRSAAGKADEIESRIDSLRHQAQSCRLTPEILSEEAAIESLHRGIEAYRDQKNTRAEKRTEAEQAEARIHTGCRNLEIDLPLDRLETLRISELDFRAANERVDAVVAAEEKLAQSEGSRKNLQKEIQRLKTQRPEAADPERLATLEKAIREAAALENLATTRDARTSAAEALNRAVETLHRQLASGSEDIESTCQLTPPAKSTIERFRDEFDESKRSGKDLDQNQLKVQREIDALDAEFKRLGRQRDVPNPEDLSSARAHRDEGWRLVLEDWKGAGASAVFVEGKPLEEAYPEAVDSADDVSDRLRTEADAVAQIEEKRAQLALAEKNLREIANNRETWSEERIALDAEWKRVWKDCGLEPSSPREMAEWRETWEELVRQWDQCRSQTEQLQKEETAIEGAVETLAAALGSDDRNFARLLAEARKSADELKKSSGAVAELNRQIIEKENELKELAATLPDLTKAKEDSEKNWESCRLDLSLPENLSANNAIEILRSRRELFEKVDQLSALTKEISQLETRITGYEETVATLAATLKIDSGEEPEISEAALWEALKEAREEQTKFDGFQRQIEETEAGLEEARRRGAKEAETFESMLRRAGLSDESELDGFLSYFEERAGHRKAIEELRNHLAGLARDEPVDDFVEKVESEDAETRGDAMTRLEEETGEFGDRIEEVRSGLQNSEGERSEMEHASDEAARQAQLAEHAAAQISQDAERFVRLRLAISILQSRIDRFREQNQGPFMEKASRWFAKITDGSFAGITLSYDAGDEPVIAGLKASGAASETVTVDGMSEGTRDQLFLALRFAGLELHLADHEPMPMILDDLLVQFDDARSRHALNALSDLAKNSQVLLFTHHRHLVELAREELGEKRFHLTELASDPA